MRLLTVGVILALLPAAAVTGAATTDAAEAAQRVLDERAAAVVEGDRERFLDSVDPDADPAFAARQVLLFEGLATVPLARYELRIRTDEIPDLSAGLAGRYAAEAVFLPPVELRYRIEGADTTDALDQFFYTFIRREGRWRIATDTDVEDVGLPSARNLWDFGPVSRAESSHFTLFFDPDDRARAEALIRLAEESFDRLADGFDRPVPERVVVILPHTLDQLREMLQATFDLSNFVAFALTTIDREEGWAATAPRVFMQDQTLGRSRRAFQLETLHHELVHVATFPLAGPFVPAWVHEGVADWLATGRSQPEPVEGTDGLLPEDYEFTAGGQTTILSAYGESTSAAAFLAQAKGRTAPLDLLVAAGRVRVAAGTSDYHLSEAMREVYGAGLAGFQEDWAAG